MRSQLYCGSYVLQQYLNTSTLICIRWLGSLVCRVYQPTEGRLQSGSPLLAGLSFLTNATLLALVVTYATVSGSWAAPESLFLVGIVAVLAVTSALSLTKRPIGGGLERC